MRYRIEGVFVLAGLSFMVGLIPGILVATSQSGGGPEHMVAIAVIAAVTAVLSQVMVLQLLAWLVSTLPGLPALFVICAFAPFWLLYFTCVWPAGLIGEWKGWLRRTA